MAPPPHDRSISRHSKPDPYFIPLRRPGNESILDDPRVQKQPGIPAFTVDVDGERYLVIEVSEGMYGDGRAGFAVFGPDKRWLGENEPRHGDRVVAPAIYPSAVQAIDMVLLPFPWERMA